MEILAANESAARRESNAFQQVILAGVSAPDLREVLRAMTEVIYRELDYERLAVLLLEGDRFTVAAAHGFAPEVQEESPRIGQGIVGRVARTGEPEILEDVRQDPDYYCADERTRSQVTVPITLGDEVIGVIDVERSELAAFDEADRDRLQRLATQMALVIGNARLLATERATVERLQELDQMKSDFIAIASHELRTPLTSIQGSIKTLRRLNDIDPATAQELMAILDRQSDRLTRLVEDLLLASRIDSGRIQLQMTSTHFTSVVDKALAQLGSAALRVSVAIAPTIPRMITDEQRLAQILRNLIENALNVSDPGTAVRLTVHHTSAGLHVEVADEGLGIAEDDRAHIFDRFHQVGGSLRRRSDGLGLGLFITRRLVEALGGTITVESELGVGTTFRVTIPLTPAVDGVSDIA
jgi:signal transduction histidine kinase